MHTPKDVREKALADFEGGKKWGKGAWFLVEDQDTEDALVVDGYGADVRMSEADQFCLVGGIYHSWWELDSAGEGDVDTLLGTDLAKVPPLVWEAICQAVSELFWPAASADDVPHWNDDASTTWEDVESVLRRALALVDQDEALLLSRIEERLAALIDA